MQQRLVSQVLVAVRPAHPSNVVKAIYTVNDGAERIARGYRVRAAARSGEEELFAVDLPSQPTAPVSRSYRFCPARVGRPTRAEVACLLLRRWCSRRLLIRPAESPSRRSYRRNSPSPTRWSSWPGLRRQLSPCEPVGETPEGFRMIFPLGRGGKVDGPALTGRSGTAVETGCAYGPMVWEWRPSTL